MSSQFVPENVENKIESRNYLCINVVPLFSLAVAMPSLYTGSNKSTPGLTGNMHICVTPAIGTEQH